MSLASRFVLFYIETLSRMDVVPNRKLYDFYRKSLCKRENGFNDVNNSDNEESKVNGVAPVKPSSSPPPPASYTPSN